MKLVTYTDKLHESIALLINDRIYNLPKLAESRGYRDFPASMLALLREGESPMEFARELDHKVKTGKIAADGIPVSKITLLAPLPDPTSCRDGYAFRQHVFAARRNRGVEMIHEFDEYPVFYFTNHNSICGPGDVWCMKDHFQQLDFELEWAAVIGKKGMNIRASEADNYIAGYVIMNDLSARLLQMEEMKLNLGPAKGKDFCTTIGPYLVTPDELKPFLVSPKENHTGNSYNLSMSCRINGETVSQGNTSDMDWTFAEIIERCAYGTPVLPGDVIGSGTVGTGCFLELNGTARLNNPDYKPRWLREGDVVELEITGLGVLTNTIRRHAADFSILELKKKVVDHIKS